MAPGEPGGSRLTLRSATEANSFLDAFAGTMRALEEVLGEETSYLAKGRVREALSREARKSELAGAYLRGLECAKANAVALKRLCPEALPGIRTAQERLREVVERNQAVIATARAVSEGLVKSVADEVSARARPAGYGAGPPSGQRASAAPLAVSRRM